VFTRTLLLTALGAALAVAPANAGVTGPAGKCAVVDRDMRQPDMARHLVYSGDAHDDEMGVTDGRCAARIIYNGHAGLGSSVYQRDQSDLEFLASG
jgi:hypothetical protein